MFRRTHGPRGPLCVVPPGVEEHTTLSELSVLLVAFVCKAGSVDCHSCTLGHSSYMPISHSSHS
eukprot:2282178-Prymnesium_polylepis.1